MSDPKPPAEPSMEAILATVRRIIAEDEFGMAKPSAGAQIVSSDVLELTEALDADGSVRQIPPSLALRGPGEPRGEPRVPPLPNGRIEPAPPRPGIAGPAGRAEAQGSRGPASGDLGRSEPVVSRARETATVSPISTGRANDAVPGGDRTIEDLVRETLRPMLQRWLDENLPDLVERVVRAEVAQTVGEAAGAQQATRAGTRPE